MYKIIRSFFVVAGIGLSLNSFGQSEVQVGNAIDGTVPLKSMHYTNVIGSPFFTPEWAEGLVKMSDGKIYKNLKIKYDQIADKVFFLGDKNEPMMFSGDVKEFKMLYTSDNKIDEAYFLKGFEPIDGADENAYYERLFPDEKSKLVLLKRVTKKIYESRVYNSAVTDRTIEAKTFYYIGNKKKLSHIKPDKKSILNVIGDKQELLNKFINENHLNLKTEDGIFALLKYYDSI